MKDKFKPWMEERFEEIIQKEEVTIDNLIELENMPFVDKLIPCGDRIILEKNGEQFYLKLKEE